MWTTPPGPDTRNVDVHANRGHTGYLEFGYAHVAAAAVAVTGEVPLHRLVRWRGTSW